MGISIQNCRKADVPSLIERFGEIYRFNPRLQELDYFDWQFKHTPFSDGRTYTFWILRDSGRINGFLGYMPLEFRYDDAVLTGCITYNWYAAEGNTAGIVLLNRLMREFDNRFLIGLSEASEKIYTLYRIPLLRKLPRWIGVLDHPAVISFFKIRGTDDCEIVRTSGQKTSGCDDASGIVYVDRFEPGMEFTLERFPRIRGYIRRTGEYLNWRYFDIPRHTYRVISNHEGGYAVYRSETIQNSPYRVIRLVEWNFTDDWAHQAISAIRNDTTCRGAILVDFFCTADDICRTLAPAGFFPENRCCVRIPYLFRPLHHADGIRIAVDLPPHRIERNLDFDQWYITKGDGDIDRVKL